MLVCPPSGSSTGVQSRSGTVPSLVFPFASLATGYACSATDALALGAFLACFAAG